MRTHITTDHLLDDLPLIRMENPLLRLEVSPQTGGRITSLYQRFMGIEFLWRNAGLPLRRSKPGDAYDPNFFGGIDEIIPGDPPEQIGGLDNPDHGELWTLPLDYSINEGELALWGVLPRWGVQYHKRIRLRPGAPWVDIDYHILNRSPEPRVFLWKLHAALNIDPGDQLVCPAQTAVVADPAWSRWQVEQPFHWPKVPGVKSGRADQIPAADGSTDFLYLYDLRAGQVRLRRPARSCELVITFDQNVFPYVHYFASYGGLDGHYTAVLEPSTAMPVSLNEAARQNQCSLLQSGEALQTRISLYAGELLPG